MLIGIDSSRAIRPRLTGTERYSREIISHLLRLPQADEHTWRLYTDREPEPELFTLEGEERSVLEQDNVEVRVLPARRMWTHRALRAEVMRNRPDVLFVPSHVVPFTLMPSRLPNAVVTVHDLGFHALPESHTLRQRLYLKWSTAWSTSTAKKVIAVSQATAADLLRFYVKSTSKIRVVYEAAYEWHPPTQAVIDEAKQAHGLIRPYALYVGTIQPRKNVARMIDAFSLLVEREHVEWDLVLAGGAGWLSEPIFDLVKASRFADRIHLTGYIPESELPGLLAGALFFCYPSLFEGFGLPVLEAQTAGVPVLTAYSSSLPEVAGNAAILVDPTDVNAIADAMLRISRDEALRQQLIEAGYENVKRFSWDKAAQETLAVLEDAANAES